MGPVDFGVKRSRSQCIDYWKWLMLHNSFPFTSIITKLHTKTPMSRGCGLMILGSKGQRSRSQCIDCWKWLMLHNCFPFTFIIMKLHTKNPLEGMVWPYWCRGQKVKGQGHNTVITENCFCCIVALSSQLKSWNFTHRLPKMLRMCPIGVWFKRSKVKVTMQWLLKMVFGA